MPTTEPADRGVRRAHLNANTSLLITGDVGCRASLIGALPASAVPTDPCPERPAAVDRMSIRRSC